jgi:hypothetical protein
MLAVIVYRNMKQPSLARVMVRFDLPAIGGAGRVGLETPK